VSRAAIEKNVTNQVNISKLKIQVSELVEIVAALQKAVQILSDKITILQHKASEKER
jgi:DNA-directed RNA polymerase subunit L